MKLPPGIDFCDHCQAIKGVRQEGRDSFCKDCGHKVRSRKSKFNNRITYIDNWCKACRKLVSLKSSDDGHLCGLCGAAVEAIKFDSAKESRRFVTLANEQTAGAVSGLRLQAEFPIVVNGEKVCTYVADFVYRRYQQGTCSWSDEIVEDTKGHRTPEYKLKRILMRVVNGINILET